MLGLLIWGEILFYVSFLCRKVYVRFGGGVCFFLVIVKVYFFDFYFRYCSLNEVGVLCVFIMLLLLNSLEKQLKKKRNVYDDNDEDMCINVLIMCINYCVLKKIF